MKDAIRSAREFRAGIVQAAAEMGKKVPGFYYAPGPGRMLNLSQYVKALKMIVANPAREFEKSFNSWSARTGAEIRRWEILPAIHERINARGILEATNTAAR